jgi:hypothetical protein
LNILNNRKGKDHAKDNENKKEVKKIRINILVAKYFINENDIENLVVDHIDGNKQNNYYKNLQYITISENIIKG